MPRRPTGPGLGLGLLLACSAVLACEEQPSEPPPPPAPRPVVDLAEVPYETLSEYGFFVGELADEAPAPGVLPYQVAAPLWADGAGKGRFLFLPEGRTLTLTERDEWELPVGSVVIKSFALDVDRSAPGTELRIIETRLLVREDDRWHSYIYRWNDEQTEATRIKAGADVFVPYTDAAGQSAEQIYIIPDENTCGECHERDDVLRLLGITTAQMNIQVQPPGGGAGGEADGEEGELVSQLEWLVEQGAIAEVPDPATLEAYPDPAGDAELDARARAYLHGNCAHCHRPGGGGGTSGLKLMAWETDLAEYGVCKVPAAAGPGTGGHSFAIGPGHPEESIMVHRMASTDPEIKMPELPSLLADDFGVDLISEWIAAMPERDCYQ
jgi:uncharacterized repeat protein (TIGR03806 family)